MKNNKRSRVIIKFVVIVIVLVLALRNDMVLRYEQITSEKIKSPIRIVFIADLHSCYYGENQTTLINAVEQAKPDLVLFGGDIADDLIPHDNTIAVISVLGERYPCYYVSGNHEYWSGEIDQIKQMFRSYQIQVLEGISLPVVVNGQVINLAGVDDRDVGKITFLNQIESAAEQADPAHYTVLMAHRPEYIETYLNYHFDLILSGHAHGGQWRIPGILNGLLAPDQGFFPKYAGGVYHFNQQQLIVSRGLARESTRVPRIFNRPELLIVDLMPISVRN